MLSFVLGTRPEIIKLAPVIRRMKDQDLPFQIVHTGQHYDTTLDSIFFSELQLPTADCNLHAASNSHATMIVKMLTGLEELWETDRPSCVIVEGDTNSVFAGAFCANRMGIPVAHVEAGLRSRDWEMPEEVNRVLTDRLSSRLYAPTIEQVQNLLQENIDEKCIRETGNTIADAVREHAEFASSIALPSHLTTATKDKYALLTLHRPALVTTTERLRTVLLAIDESVGTLEMKCLFLMHPRTAKQLESLNLELKNIHQFEPVGYLPMLQLLQNAAMVITDSGGIQEEAALLQVPCVTIRENTERPETVLAGGNRIAGFESEDIKQAIADFASSEIQWRSVYDIDNPSDTIVEDLLQNYA